MKFILEEGMWLYRGDGNYRVKITRTTAKRAFAMFNNLGKEMAFNREQHSSGYIKVRGEDVWIRHYYAVETPELKAKYERMILKSMAQRLFDVEKLSNEQLIEIIAILEKKHS